MVSAAESARGAAGPICRACQARKRSGCPTPSPTVQIPRPVVAIHTGPTGESVRVYAMLVFNVVFLSQQ